MKLRLKEMAKHLFLLVLILAFFYTVSPGVASAQLVPFGGPVTYLQPCVNGVNAYIGPPIPVPLMWMPGSATFASGPPSFIGQYLLGLAGPTVPCIGPLGFPIGFGLFIIMMGSSGLKPSDINGGVDFTKPPVDGVPNPNPNPGTEVNV